MSPSPSSRSGLPLTSKPSATHHNARTVGAQMPGTDRHPSSPSWVSSDRSVITGLTMCPITPSMLYEKTRRLTPICGPASPARPGWSTVSSRSRTSAARSLSNALTSSAGVRSTGSPISRMGRTVTTGSLSAERRAPDQHHLVAVHDLPAVLRLQLAALAAQQRRQLPRVVGDQPPGDHDAVRTDQLDRVVGEELPRQ